MRITLCGISESSSKKRNGVTAMEMMRDRVITGTGYCYNTLMMATGIPSYLIIVHVKAEIREMKQSHAHHVQHGVNMSELLVNLMVILLENFTVDGVAPVNMADVTHGGSYSCVAQDSIAETSEQVDNSTMQSDFQTFYFGVLSSNTFLRKFAFQAPIKTLYGI